MQSYAACIHCGSVLHSSSACVCPLLPCVSSPLLLLHVEPHKLQRILLFIQQQIDNHNINNNIKTSFNSHNIPAFTIKHIPCKRNPELLLLKFQTTEHSSSSSLDGAQLPATVFQWMLNHPLISRHANSMYFVSSHASCTSESDVLSSLSSLLCVPSSLPVGGIRVQTYPKSLRKSICQHFQHVNFVPHQYQHVLDVVYMPHYSRCVWGIRAQLEQLQPPLDAPLSQQEQPLCRAYHKISEVFLYREHWSIQPGCHSLDIGASPGGWTSFMLEHGAHVLAVDPGDMQVDSHTLTHIRAHVEEAQQQILQYVNTHERFEYILCDMNVRPSESASMILSLSSLSLLSSTCRLVLTVKSTSLGSTRAHIDALIKQLGTKWKDIKLIQLLANGKEKTITATRKTAEEEEAEASSNFDNANVVDEIKTSATPSHPSQPATTALTAEQTSTTSSQQVSNSATSSTVASSFTFNSILTDSSFVQYFRTHPVELILPASKVNDQTVEAIQHLISIGFLFHFPSMIAPHPFHSNTDDQRLHFLAHSMGLRSSSNSASARIIWCVRGGYGSGRLVRKLHAEVSAYERSGQVLPRRLLIGFSDITCLHLYMSHTLGFYTMHAPVTMELFNKEKDVENFTRIKQILSGEKQEMVFHLTPLNSSAHSLSSVSSTTLSGPLTGGNLCLFQSALGCPWQPRINNHIIILEDTKEPGYKIDRMLNHLLNACIFDNARAVVLGFFDRGDELVQTALDRFAVQVATEFNLPVFITDEIGHGDKNYPWLYNAIATIQPHPHNNEQATNFNMIMQVPSDLFTKPNA